MATLPGAWCFTVRTRTGWTGASILWLGEKANVICRVCLSVTAHTKAKADPFLRYTLHVPGTLSNQEKHFWKSKKSANFYISCILTVCAFISFSLSFLLLQWKKDLLAAIVKFVQPLQCPMMNIFVMCSPFLHWSYNFNNVVKCMWNDHKQTVCLISFHTNTGYWYLIYHVRFFLLIYCFCEKIIIPFKTKYVCQIVGQQHSR